MRYITNQAGQLQIWNVPANSFRLFPLPLSPEANIGGEHRNARAGTEQVPEEPKNAAQGAEGQIVGYRLGGIQKMRKSERLKA
jgi:hypothetical protein